MAENGRFLGSFTDIVTALKQLCISANTINQTLAAYLPAGSSIVTVQGTIAVGTGAQTINKSCGAVNFAAAAASLVVTNSLVNASSSLIFPTILTNDATMTSVRAIPGSGSFTIIPNAAPTGITKVGFLVVNVV